ncbi:MAG TPA: rhomboid family intramembrane serine protease [Flavisolibacter sp.]|jgi:membrane associated rhomboid family serine protease
MSDFRFTRPDEFPPIVKNLIIINVLVFLAQLLLDQRYFLTARIGLWPVETPLFRPYQIVTHMFSHSPRSIGHIFFNMFALWMFGKILENVWGGKRFLLFYLACGIGAAALHLLVAHLTGGMVPVVGASGAVMGVIVGFAYLFPNTEMFILFIPFPIKAKWVAIAYVAIDLFSGIANVAGDNVAHFAHLGGAITGFILVLIWNKSDRRRFY